MTVVDSSLVKRLSDDITCFELAVINSDALTEVSESIAAAEDFIVVVWFSKGIEDDSVSSVVVVELSVDIVEIAVLVVEKSNEIVPTSAGVVVNTIIVVCDSGIINGLSEVILESCNDPAVNCNAVIEFVKDIVVLSIVFFVDSNVTVRLSNNAVDSATTVVNSIDVAGFFGDIAVISVVIVVDSAVVVQLSGDVVCSGIVVMNSTVVVEVSAGIIVVSRVAVAIVDSDVA